MEHKSVRFSIYATRWFWRCRPHSNEISHGRRNDIIVGELLGEWALFYKQCNMPPVERLFSYNSFCNMPGENDAQTDVKVSYDGYFPNYRLQLII